MVRPPAPAPPPSQAVGGVNKARTARAPGVRGSGGLRPGPQEQEGGQSQWPWEVEQRKRGLEAPGLA